MYFVTVVLVGRNAGPFLFRIVWGNRNVIEIGENGYIVLFFHFARWSSVRKLHWDYQSGELDVELGFYPRQLIHVPPEYRAALNHVLKQHGFDFSDQREA